jgi:hypothetical protein
VKPCWQCALGEAAQAFVPRPLPPVSADRRRLLASPKAGPASYRLFEMLPMMARFTVERVRQALSTTFPTANAAVKVLGDLGIVAELTGQKKNGSYSYQPYIALLSL